MDRVLALFAFAVFCGFLFILFINVPRIDLGLVILATVLFCAYDFYKVILLRRTDRSGD